MNITITRLLRSALPLALLTLTACGGGGGAAAPAAAAVAAYTIGGALTGLTGTGLVLQDNAADDLAVSANGTFTFVAPVTSGAAYAVAVKTQPGSPVQTCTVNSGSGTASANVTSVKVICSANAYTVGGTVSGLTGTGLVLQDNAGDNLAVSANGAFSFAASVASGAGYSVTVKTQPSVPAQNCIVGSGSGTVSTANIASVTVSCSALTPPRYAFTANFVDNSVSSYVVDASTGRLKYIGKAAAGLGPKSVTIDPAGKYAYAANYRDGTVSQYTIGTNGALTPMAPPTVASGLKPNSVTVDPSGKYAYVANSFNGAGGNSVSQYTIGTTGALTPMSTAWVLAGTSPYSVTVDPSGKYAYAANYSGTVSQYAIGMTGALTAMGAATVNAGASPTSVTVDPTGKYAYVANHGAGTVSQYTIGTTGELSPIAAAVAASSTPQSVTVDPSGKYAYVANNNGTVLQYAIGTTGELSAMTPATVAAGGTPISVTVDPSGKYAYVANWGGNCVSQYTIGATGALTAISPATVAAAVPASIVVSAGAAAVQAVPQYAYVANNNGTVSQYTIGTTGALTPMTPAFVAGGWNPISITVDPSGKYAYVANSLSITTAPYTYVSSVSQYTIGTNGALTPMSPATVVSDASPSSVTVDPSGRYAYVAASGSAGGNGTVSQYTIGTNGALTPMAPATVAAGVNPTSVTVDPSGQYAYVANSYDGAGGNSVSQYTIGTNGALTPMTPAFVAASRVPSSVTVDPSGKYAYVTNNYDGTFSQYTIGANGALTPMAIPIWALMVTAGDSPTSVTVDPSGKYAYVANFTGNYSLLQPYTVSQYTIGTNGALTPMAQATVAAGVNPTSVTVNASGKYAYVTNNGFLSVPAIPAFNGSAATPAIPAGGGTVSQYSIGANGALTPIATTAADGSGPISIITTGTWQ